MRLKHLRGASYFAYCVGCVFIGLSGSGALHFAIIGAAFIVAAAILILADVVARAINGEKELP